MTYGYSQYLVKANKAAGTRYLGVVLGRLCIARDISVQSVADKFGVSRMTVYNWFKGVAYPSPVHAKAIQRYINELNKKA